MPHWVAAKAAGVPPGAAKGPARKRSTWSWAGRALRFGCAGNVTCAMAVLALLVPAAWSPLLARTVTVAADVAEEVGGAAGRMMGAGANVSSSAARIFSAITDNTLNFAETAWEGIDLTNVSVQSSAGRFFFDGQDDPVEVLALPEARALMGLPDFWQQSLVDISIFASPSRPIAEVHRHHFHTASYYSSLDLWLVWLDTGHVGLAWRWASVTYAARWSNPLWDLTADVTAEHIRISAMLQDAVQATIVRPDLSLNRDALASAPALQPPPWPLVAWRWGKRLAAWVWPRAESGPPPTTSAGARQGDDAAEPPGTAEGTDSSEDDDTSPGKSADL